MSNPIYALILAGGSGERFWPLSRRNRPKQLLRLISKRTLLEETVARLEGFVPAKRTLILTNIEQENAVRDLLKNFPKQNIIAEPAKRDTAAAVALGAGWVAARDHSATMLAFPADHVIADRTAFQETMKTAAVAAEETGALVTIGIKPTWACPGFGYIEQGTPVPLRGDAKIALSGKTECRSGRVFFAQRELSLERGHVRLVRADCFERIQSARARVGRFYFPSAIFQGSR